MFGIAPRRCECGCGEMYDPTRKWQKYAPGHREDYWKRVFAEARASIAAGHVVTVVETSEAKG